MRLSVSFQLLLCTRQGHVVYNESFCNISVFAKNRRPKGFQQALVSTSCRQWLQGRDVIGHFWGAGEVSADIENHNLAAEYPTTGSNMMTSSHHTARNFAFRKFRYSREQILQVAPSEQLASYPFTELQWPIVVQLVMDLS